LGSENISGNSLNFNRELGIILKGQPDTELFIETFDTDWAHPDAFAWPPKDELPPPTNQALPVYDETKTLYTPMTAGPVQPCND